MMNREIAVVVLNWNGALLLETYLPTLLKYTPKDLAEVIVADNGSSDHSIELLAKMGVRTLAFSENLGFAGGYNEAIAELSHPFILLLNSDVEVSERWLEPLYHFIKEHPEVVAVQPKIRSLRDPSRYEYAGAEGGYMDFLGYPFCRGRLFDTVERDLGQYGSEAKEVFWTTGAAMLVRREAYLEAGGLDGSFFAHQEEIDLCWRWQCRGWKLFVVPESVVYHLGGASLSHANPHKTFLNFRNNLLMLYKNLPTRRLWYTMIVRFLLDLVAATYFLIGGEPKGAWAVLRAWSVFLKKKKVREKNFDRKRGFRRIYKHSLLVQYYLMGRRVFKQLKR